MLFAFLCWNFLTLKEIVVSNILTFSDLTIWLGYNLLVRLFRLPYLRRLHLLFSRRIRFFLLFSRMSLINHWLLLFRRHWLQLSMKLIFRLTSLNFLLFFGLFTGLFFRWWLFLNFFNPIVLLFLVFLDSLLDQLRLLKFK